MYRPIAIFSCFILTACGGGGGGDAPSPVVNQSLGGIWTGIDNSGNDIIALATETGQFHFLDLTNDAQGFGTGSVANGNSVSLSYTIVAALGTTLSDGSTSGTCAGTGTVQQRQSLSVSVSCTTSASSWTGSATLTYDATYDRDSSLALVAGNYDDLGDVLNINSNGVLFEQSATTGCVLNGQVSIINSAWNAYDVAFTVSSCQGQETVLNGSVWDGIAVLELDAGNETLIAAVTGTVQGTTFSLIAAFPEI
jgi:hypothetical protein